MRRAISDARGNVTCKFAMDRLIPLIYISAGATALAWLLVPLIGVDAIEVRARAGEEAVCG